MRVVVVGAGIAGAACARELTAAGAEVSVLERAKAPGGRMAAPTIEGRRVDIGAAYLTARDPDFLAVVDNWQSRGLVRAWTDTLEVIGSDGPGKPATGTTRYAAPDGLRALVRDLLADQDVTLGRDVHTVEPGRAGPTVDGAPADAVVLAMPDPQAARIAPSVTDRADAGYDPVITVTAGWTDRLWPIENAAFVNDHADVALVADDGARRGDGAPVLVVHSTPERARQHLDDPASAVAPVLAALGDVLGLTAAPLWTRAHRWTFAKPAGTHGDAAYTLGADRIGVAGDSWCPTGSPRVESAWLSGRALARALLARLS